MGANNPAGTEGVQELNEPDSAMPPSQVIKIYHTAKKHTIYSFRKKGRMQENN